MIIIFFDLGILVIIALFAFLGGAMMLENIVAFLFGPIKFIIIILFVISLAASVLTSLSSDSQSGTVSKCIGIICNVVSSIIRDGINIVFFLCILLGFLQNMSAGGVFHTLWALFAIVGDLLVFLLFFSLSLTLPAALDSFTDRIPMFLLGIINLIWALFHLFIIQCILTGFYHSSVEQLFSGYSDVSDFILSPWVLNLL